MEKLRAKTILATLAIAVCGLAVWSGVNILAHSYIATTNFQPASANANSVCSATVDNSPKLNIAVAGTAMTEEWGDGLAKDAWKLSVTVTAPTHKPDGTPHTPAHRWKVFFVRDVAGTVGTVNYNTNNGSYQAVGKVRLDRGYSEHPDGAQYVFRSSPDNKVVSPEEEGDFFIVGAIWDDLTQNDPTIDHCTYSVWIEAEGDVSCSRNGMGAYVDLKSPLVLSGDGAIDYYDDNWDTIPLNTWWIEP